MKHFTLSRMLGSALVALTCSMGAEAIERPTIAQKLTEGETYLLMNYASPALYSTRTSWDGAYMLMNYENWQNNTGAWQPIDLTAVKNEDDTWSFYYEATEKNEEGEETVVKHYMGVPDGMINILARSTERNSWTVEPGDYEGYYRLTAADDHANVSAAGCPLLLNSNGEWPIVFAGTYDVYGGVKFDEWGDVVYDESGHPLLNDTDHLNWAFVREADIEGYNARIKVWEAVDNMEKNYVEQEPDFADGFQKAIDAASAIYDDPNGNLDEAIAILEAKKALFNQILNTFDLNEDDDDALAAAIEKAIAEFNATGSLEETNKTAEELANALKGYFLSKGDYTYFGKNMSFEDLSNQNSSGVSNAPAGWNIYINGKLTNTSTEIQKAGITAWCAINNDAAGMRDGEMAFGIWNGSIPEFEISQTITDLPNGSYNITAAMMVGANGSGSRMTTQRIFGNFNSALFGHEYQYNTEYLDPSEVYSFADCDEPYTDTELQDVSLEAYVYDGTLTFGLRTNGEWRAVNGRTGGNGAGGDGWFKLDNFRIKYAGYDEGKAIGILQYFKDQIAEYGRMSMQEAVRLEAERLCQTSPEGMDEINAAILNVHDIIAAVKSSVDAYKAMADYLELCFDNMNMYADYTAFPQYEKAVLDASDLVDEEKLDEAGLAELRSSLEQALADLLLSGVAVGKDVTDVIANPSFEDTQNIAVPYGWNLYLDGDKCETAADVTAHGIAWCAIGEGDQVNVVDEEGNVITHQYTDGENLWGIWSNIIPEVELSQTIVGLPAGTYTLTADVMVQWNWAGDCLTTQRIFANDAICMFGHPQDYLYNATPDMLKALEADRAAGFHIEADDYVYEEEDEQEEEETRAAETEEEDVDAYRLMNYGRYDYQADPIFDLPQTLTVKFVVDDSGVAKIGFRTNNVNRHGVAVASGIGWFKLDNFTLFYESRHIHTSVHEPASAASAKAEFYTLNGMRLSTPQRGINIVVTTTPDGNKTTQKVIVK